MRFRKVVTVLCLIVGALILIQSRGRSSAQTERGKALASLVEAERAFARTSGEKGIREAFLTWLAPDAIVFRPGPVEGRPVYEKMDPANPAVLTWEPEFAEIAASGELGYTTGPYEVRPRRGAAPSGFGHYISIWKMQPDDGWKVFLDIGVQHGVAGSPPAGGEVASPSLTTRYAPLSPEALRDEEYAFGRLAGSFDQAAGTKGTRRALEEFASDDVRVYRPGKPPAIGKRGLKELIPAEAGRAEPGTERRRGMYQVGVAWSGDLAYSFGTWELSKTPAAAEKTAFLRIWRKDASGMWKVCLDIELAVPPEKQKAG
jgi:ketosteroid isomerase-like protein